ncbi:putative membrane protein [Edaphobacter aggregans]|jgi:uncharacterized membrane protein|uniref:Putative membrane protein n=1 Tax=Edaphobacter aggregans TaxID=570835 RepID=A0A3R9NUU9_9BACT|nr:DUF4870 domain-containing protein [Edaphobacter aggregans]RSL15111.1 putative membrane protein [Edaphobacter aggregans]
MQCPVCNTETGSTSAFCPHCGANTGTGAAQAIAAQPSGLSDTAAGTIAYLTFIPAIIFLAMEPYNRSSYVRFHAWQSIFLGIAIIAINTILGLIPIVGWIAAPIVSLGFLILWIMVLIKASKGERYKVPFIGNFADQQAK